eukprot:COSAG01_NODE_5370_length_4303_cov_1.671265_6_plen_239_part_00
MSVTVMSVSQSINVCQPPRGGPVDNGDTPWVLVTSAMLDAVQAGLPCPPAYRLDVVEPRSGEPPQLVLLIDLPRLRAGVGAGQDVHRTRTEEAIGEVCLQRGGTELQLTPGIVTRIRYSCGSITAHPLPAPFGWVPPPGGPRPLAAALTSLHRAPQASAAAATATARCACGCRAASCLPRRVPAFHPTQEYSGSPPRCRCSPRQCHLARRARCYARPTTTPTSTPMPMPMPPPPPPPW